MATITTTILVDDLDGTESTTDDSVAPVTITYRGATYELHLTADNRDRLASSLAPFLEKSRRVSGKGKAKGSPSPISEWAKANAGVRAWARANGWPDLGERGRIPAAVLAAYNAAQDTP